MKLIQDHIIGLAAGGLDVVGNYQWLCQPCHTEKTKAEQAAGRARAIAKRGHISKRYRDLEEHPGRKAVRDHEGHAGQTGAQQS